MANVYPSSLLPWDFPKSSLPGPRKARPKTPSLRSCLLLTTVDFDAVSSMAQADVDMKFLSQFATNVDVDHPFLSKTLFTILGNLTMLSDRVIRARKLRRLDTTRDTKAVDLYCRIIWYAREGLKLLEEYILPMVANFGPLKVLCHKLRASYYHLYVLFHNTPHIRMKSGGGQVSTPPGLKSPRVRKLDKGKAPERDNPGDDIYRPSSVQPTHPLEGGPVGGISPPPPDFAPNFLVPSADYRPIALQCFQEATHLAEKLLWGSHPLRLSVRVEYSAFLYDCLHERDSSRQLAKATIAEVYNAQEGMDDDMFEDAAALVGILGKMMKRGLGSGSASTPGTSTGRTPPRKSTAEALPSPMGMINPI
ncbi:14-3-3 protein [Glarea lozoyensis ATCC 20868]|uniref:14-3-3 protein n=1 Tax=Glarea lozoyensis (strain ATCC 20868 / MF5171) TaxID=1116229 RepID=S3D9Y7_GLAL2|nr:14-3-3 protein [Glarea lozoyensis ATCC 20868]EPE34570.1 14-3-3 protein [Glarea lozoyensis ATCC 20868]